MGFFVYKMLLLRIPVSETLDADIYTPEYGRGPADRTLKRRAGGGVSNMNGWRGESERQRRRQIKIDQDRSQKRMAFETDPDF